MPRNEVVAAEDPGDVRSGRFTGIRRERTFEPCNLVLHSRAAMNGCHAQRRCLRAAPMRAWCSRSALHRPGVTTDEVTCYHKTMSIESVKAEPVSGHFWTA